MNFLLDTHTFVWWVQSPASLSQAARDACVDATNALFLSVASIWEIQIKAQIGKLHLGRPLEEIVDFEVQNNHLQVLGIELRDIYGLQHLPLHHRDPFDRMLLAQSNAAGLTLVTRDSSFQAYGAITLW